MIGRIQQFLHRNSQHLEIEISAPIHLSIKIALVHLLDFFTFCLYLPRACAKTLQNQKNKKPSILIDKAIRAEVCINVPPKVVTGVFLSFSFFLVLLPALLVICFSLVPTYSQSSEPNEPPLVTFAKHPQFEEALITRSPVALGAATAEFQDEGPYAHPHTQFGQLYLQDQELLATVGEPLDAWNHPEKVIDRLKELGFTEYRFSVSRDKVEPQPGVFDLAVIEIYQHFCRELIRNAIRPMVTLDHFSQPLYFSWDNEEGIDGFINYAKQISEALYAVGVRKIATINEPTSIAFAGWVAGVFPPHHTRDFEGAGHVLKNMITAHERVYEALKEAHPDFEVGITHQVFRFRPFHKLNPFLAPLEKVLCYYLTEVTHAAFFRCLQTGHFSLKVPFQANYQFSIEKPQLDFIGLQYYSDPLLNLLKGLVARAPDQDLTAYGYRTYPQGLASAIEECSTLGVPIDLTEIGIDTGINKEGDGDARRIRYFNRIFQVVTKALEEGKNVRSLYFWTLIDNLEWHQGWKTRFGLYSRSPEGEILPRGAALWLQSLKTPEPATPLAYAQQSEDPQESLMPPEPQPNPAD